MPRGRITAIVLTLSPREEAVLQEWLRSTTIEHGRSQRAQIILGVVAGKKIVEIARQAGLSRSKTYKWIYRFQAQRVQGLYDATGRWPHRAQRRV